MKIIFEEFNLNKLGEELVKVIKSRKNIFIPIRVIVPNNKVEQWFKSYWLKHHSEVLMNISFELIDNALFNLIEKPNSYKLITREQLRSLIIKLISEKNDISFPDNIKNYIFKDKKLDHIRLYDLSNKLSQLYLEYEQDLNEIYGWEKELYDLVIEEALKLNLVTLSSLFNNEQTIRDYKYEIYFFGFNKFTKLQEKIINTISLKNDIKILSLKQNPHLDNDFLLMTAPSRLREIEAVHSKICELLKDENNKLSDFLVLASDISLYEGVIPRIFNQDNINFPNIPYVINDRKRVNTSVNLGLKKLFEILNKKFYTRLDFFNLINNKDIQESRGITELDIINWSKAIIDMNVYRNNNNCDDWDYAKKRVLIAKISGINDINNNIVELSNDKYLPFSSIDFDDESIIRFVDAIDDLSFWLKTISNIEYINNDNLLLIKGQLDKWFSKKDVNGFENNRYYKKIINCIDFLLNIELPNDVIPLNTLFYILLDVTTVTQVNNGDYFTRGITFSDFDDKAILSAKYIFFLNASSSEFPKPVVKSELDLRDYDITNIEDIENSFFIQCQNATEKFFISYVNKDLKTDEDYYPSSFILKLKQRVNLITKELSLDETRSWTELFTKKEYKNKNYYLSLLKTKDSDDIKNEQEYQSDTIKKIRVKDMAEFLEEPLKTKAKRLFGREDAIDEDLKEEFEPFEIDNITNSVLTKKICIVILNNQKEIEDDDNFPELFERFNLEHKLPNVYSTFNLISYYEVLDDSKNIIKHIKEVTSELPIPKKLDDLPLEIGNSQWILTCDQEVCIYEEGTTRTYLQIKRLPTRAKESDFLYLYVISLMDIASLDGGSYDIVLDRGNVRTFSITRDRAKELLNNIYNAMNDYELDNNVYLPINIFENKKIKSLYDLIDNLTQKDGSPWSYFDDKKLFDYDSQLGYESKGFFKRFKEKRDEHIKLIAYYKAIEESEGDNNE